MATTAITEDTPIRMPSTVRNERSLFARSDVNAMRMASLKGTAATSATRLRSSFSILPSRMWIVRWACSAMSCSWVTRMIVLPCSCSRANSRMMSSPVAESRLPVGSSASRIEGFMTSARAMATRWRWPPESSFGLWFMRSARSTSSSAPLRALEPGVLRHAGVDERQLDVVQGAGARQQVEGLEDEADLAVADRRQLVVVHLRDDLAAEHVGALARRVEAADQVHQRRLARARGSHDGHVLALARSSKVTPRRAWISSAPIW